MHTWLAICATFLVAESTRKTLDLSPFPLPIVSVSFLQGIVLPARGEPLLP